MSEHEGQRLAALLKQHNKTQVQLAAAAGKTQQAATKWVATVEFRPAALDTVRDALAKLGINPDELRPVRGTFSRDRSEEFPQKIEDLRTFVQGFSKRQIENILHILRAAPDARQQLAAILEDRLTRE